jgi:molybdopterin-guanine dinucleotide biosynthesis protein A
LAIDLPEMTTEHLLRIWESARPGVGVVPQCGERYEPLAAIYPATAESNAARALAMNRLSLRSLIEDLLEQQKIGIYPVNDDEKRLYRNVNSPDDLR